MPLAKWTIRDYNRDGNQQENANATFRSQDFEQHCDALARRFQTRQARNARILFVSPSLTFLFFLGSLLVS